MTTKLKILALFLMCMIQINAQESDLLQHFGKPPNFDEKLVNNFSKVDTLHKYSGTYLNFSKDNILYYRSAIDYHEASKTQNIEEWLKWNWSINEYYSKDGKLVKKDLWFIRNNYMEQWDNIFPNILESYFLSRNGYLEKSQNIGDPLFRSTFQEIISVLEKNGINPLELKISVYSRLSKIISPKGFYWEYSPTTVQGDQVYVLIDDKTRKVVMKTFDTSPQFISSLRVETYLKKREDLFDPEKNNFKLGSNVISDVPNDIRNIIERIYPDHAQIITYPILKGLWFAQVYMNEINYNFSLIFIDDDTGEIVLNSAGYEKSYLGEEDFKKDVNKLLLRYYEKK